MRLYRLSTGDYANLDAISYIHMYDTYADVSFPGLNGPVTVSGADYVKLKAWLAATADANNQPLATMTRNPAAMPTDTSKLPPPDMGG